jgi:large repetitive protein
MAQRQWRSDDTDPWVYGFGNGSDGTYTPTTSTEAPIDSSASGTSGTTSLSATNASFDSGQLILIWQVRGTGAGGWELNRISSYSTGTITTAHDLTMTYTDSGNSQAYVRVLKQYSNVLIDTGVTLTSKAWDGNVGGLVGWFCKGKTTVTGTITATGKGYRGATAVGAQANAKQGGSHPNESFTTATTANTGGGGGGLGTGDADGADGGGGGNYSGGAGSGTNGDGGVGHVPGSAGSTYGVATLVSLFPGSGGGGGGGSIGVSGSTGGAGGGAVAIFSKEITITGSIVTGGTTGGTGSGDSGSAGGGAGGSVLVKSQVATLGTAKITAPAGGAGAKSGEGGAGGAGGTGRIRLDYSHSYTGTTTPTLSVVQDTTIVDLPTAFFSLI